MALVLNDTYHIVGCEGRDADVVIVMDESGSIGNGNFEKVRDFVASVIEKLDLETGRVNVFFTPDAMNKIIIHIILVIGLSQSGLLKDI